MSTTNSWRQAARGFYDLAVSSYGYTGSLLPNALDSEISSMRKVCFYTAFIADNL